MFGFGALVTRISTLVRRLSESIYAVASKEPELVFDFAEDYYRTSGSDATFADSITHARASNATMVDADGLLKWAPHNLLFPSDDLTGLLATAGASALDAEQLSFGALANSQLYKFFTGAANAEFTIDVEAKVDAGTANFRLKLQDSADDNYSANKVAITEWQTFSHSFVADQTVCYIGLVNGTDATAQTVRFRKIRVYRSDLGGMVNNPDRGDSYVPTTTSARYLPRRGHHVYNGDSWVDKGVLVESEARTNLFTNSSDLGSTTWLDQNSTISASPTLTGPDGAVSAHEFTTIATASALIYQGGGSIAISADEVCSLSVYAKANTHPYVAMDLQGAGGKYAAAVFDISSSNTEATETSVGISDGVIVLTSQENIGNGWYRLTLSGKIGTTLTEVIPWIGFAETATGNLFSALGQVQGLSGSSKSFYIYGMQFERGASTSSSYIPTSGSTVTRAADSLTVPSANLPWPTPEVIGEELVTNGTFDTDLTGWTYGNEWSWSNGKAVDGSSTFNNYLQQNITTTSGSVYLIQYSLSDVAGGNPALFINGSLIQAHGFNGDYSYIYRASASSSNLQFGGAFATFAIDNISVKEINPLALSIQMDGEMTYADTGVADEVQPYYWYLNSSNRIQTQLSTITTRTGELAFRQTAAGVSDFVTTGQTAYSPGTNVPFNIASRHGSTFINGAVDGTALTDDTTPTALPDLSATNLNLAYDYMGTIKTFRMWADDLGDEGIEEASAPSVVPSLSLTFDGASTSFTDTGMTV